MNQVNSLNSYVHDDITININTCIIIIVVVDIINNGNCIGEAA